MISVTNSQKRALIIATILTVIAGFYFLRAYLMLIIFAAIVALIFNPVYKRLLRKGRSPASAASITLLVSIGALIIPSILIAAVTVYQVADLAGDISNYSQDTDLHTVAQDAINSLNNFLASVGIHYTLELSTIVDGVKNAVKSVGSSIASGALSTLSGFFAFFTIAIIYMYVFMSILKNQDKLLRTFHDLNPLGRDIGGLYVEKAGAMTKAMVRGQFIIAFCQGFVDAALIYLAGIHSAFFFFLIVLTALSIIPLGGGILAIPIGIILMLTGNIWGGLLIIVGHIVIVTNIDNVLRPKLVPREARLDPALTLLAVFSGLKLFGFLGIIIGPVIMILLVTTIKVFVEVYKGGAPADENPKIGKKHTSKFNFLRRKPAKV